MVDSTFCHLTPFFIAQPFNAVDLPLFVAKLFLFMSGYFVFNLHYECENDSLRKKGFYSHMQKTLK